VVIGRTIRATIHVSPNPNDDLSDRGAEMQEIDQRDRELLGALQGELPLVSTPFAFVGQKIDMSEKEVIKRTERLKRDGIVKGVAGHFDTRALGYRSCLVAARVQPDRIDEAAATISAHPGVTQNYKRNHDFNLWFTLAVSPSSTLGLDKTIEILGDEAECEVTRALPTLKLYKSASSDAFDGHGTEAIAELTAVEIESVRLLQSDLPLQPRPFDVLSKTGGITAEELLQSARVLLRRGQMRRYGAIIQTRKPGFSASAMGVWVVPPENADELGETMSRHRGVSHCYLRPVYQDWPYNLYTIVHGRSVDECESIINDLAIDTGLTERQALYPTKEYKKSRLTLFAREAEAWETAHATDRAASAVS
jgi:DNA-binding Lrp family transcriptional regulator